MAKLILAALISLLALSITAKVVLIFDMLRQYEKLGEERREVINRIFEALFYGEGKMFMILLLQEIEIEKKLEYLEDSLGVLFDPMELFRRF